MTANQLADLNEWSCCAHSKQVSAMLRQQQAELDAFKLNYYNTGYSLQLRDKDETIKQQAKEIAMLKQIIDANNLQSDIGQLKKELALQKLSDISQEIENEPVAWMTENGTIFDVLPLIVGGLIPLYTHPMREEIDAKRYQWLRNEFANGRETYLAEGIPSGEQLDKYIDEQLKKASEK